MPFSAILALLAVAYGETVYTHVSLGMGLI